MNRFDVNANKGRDCHVTDTDMQTCSPGTHSCSKHIQGLPCPQTQHCVAVCVGLELCGERSLALDVPHDGLHHLRSGALPPDVHRVQLQGQTIISITTPTALSS